MPGLADFLRKKLNRTEPAGSGSERPQESSIDADSRMILPGDQGRPALVVPLDYDEVVPRVKSREAFPALVQLFESHLDGMVQTYSELFPIANLCDVPNDRTDAVSPYWNNDFFTGADALIAYAFTRLRAPVRILEIGSGNSTRFFRKAIQDAGLKTKLVSIDPCPRVEVAQIADEILRIRVQDVPLATFASLEAGDILFFDGSHLCFHDSDVTHFFLKILPEVASGVLVHVHDIRLPYEYPSHFDTRYYNEQYILAAFLLYNLEWLPVLPVHFLSRKGVLEGDGGSFWMQRKDSSTGVTDPR